MTDIVKQLRNMLKNWTNITYEERAVIYTAITEIENLRSTVNAYKESNDYHSYHFRLRRK